MKKAALLLILISLPLFAFAKYCPSCLNTFQVQTIRGQSQLLYRWMIKAMNPKNPLKQQNIKALFDKKITIFINGRRIATGLPATYQYLIRLRQQHPLLESKLRKLLVDQNYVAISYQKITGRKRNKYRTIVMAILEFKGHKLIEWRSLTHTTKIG